MASATVPSPGPDVAHRPCPRPGPGSHRRPHRSPHARPRREGDAEGRGSWNAPSTRSAYPTDASGMLILPAASPCAPGAQAGRCPDTPATAHSPSQRVHYVFAAETPGGQTLTLGDALAELVADITEAARTIGTILQRGTDSRRNTNNVHREALSMNTSARSFRLTAIRQGFVVLVRPLLTFLFVTVRRGRDADRDAAPLAGSAALRGGHRGTAGKREARRRLPALAIGAARGWIHPHGPRRRAARPSDRLSTGRSLSRKPLAVGRGNGRIAFSRSLVLARRSRLVCLPPIRRITR